jgi:hypothetical protein
VIGFVARLDGGVTGLVTMCDVCCVGVTAFVTCDGVAADVTGLIEICDGFGFVGVTGFDLLGNVWGSLAGFDSVGITADVTGGITVVTGVDGADTADEDLPLNKKFGFKILSYHFIFNFHCSFGSWGRFVEQKLMLNSSFRCDQIHDCQRYDFGHTLLCYLSLT